MQGKWQKVTFVGFMGLFLSLGSLFSKLTWASDLKGDSVEACTLLLDETISFEDVSVSDLDDFIGRLKSKALSPFANKQAYSKYFREQSYDQKVITHQQQTFLGLNPIRTEIQNRLKVIAKSANALARTISTVSDKLRTDSRYPRYFLQHPMRYEYQSSGLIFSEDNHPMAWLLIFFLTDRTGLFPGPFYQAAQDGIVAVRELVALLANSEVEELRNWARVFGSLSNPGFVPDLSRDDLTLRETLQIELFPQFNKPLVERLQQMETDKQLRLQQIQADVLWVLQQMDIQITILDAANEFGKLTMPVIDSDSTLPRISAEGMHNPYRVLTGSSVPNEIHLDANSNRRLGLLVGTNGGGKSNWQVGIAINLLLAQKGAPVFADSWVWTPLKLFMDRRTLDRPSENLSAAQAQFRNLGRIRNQLANYSRSLVLMDEPATGTNEITRTSFLETFIDTLLALPTTLSVLTVQEWEMRDLVDKHSALGAFNMHVSLDPETRFQVLEGRPDPKKALQDVIDNARALMEQAGFDNASIETTIARIRERWLLRRFQ